MSFHQRFHQLCGVITQQGISEFDAQCLALQQIQAEVAQGVEYTFDI